MGLNSLSINRRYIAIVFSILVGLASGCQQSTTDPAPDDSTYFPLQTGDYWVYQVTQETYSLTNAATKRTFQLQEKIGNSFIQNGQLVFQIEESIKRSEQANWQINAIRTVYKNVSEVVSVDGNVPLVNLIFPISATTSWNVNTYNARPDTLLRYEHAGQPLTIGKQTFNRTVSVVGANDSTLIGLDHYRRVYAQNIGLVYRENTSFAYCQSSPDCIGKEIIASGTRQIWSLMASNRLP